MRTKDKQEILAQYKLGYAYTKEQIIRWYGVTEKEADKLMSQGAATKKKSALNRGQ